MKRLKSISVLFLFSIVTLSGMEREWRFTTPGFDAGGLLLQRYYFELVKKEANVDYLLITRGTNDEHVSEWILINKNSNDLSCIYGVVMGIDKCKPLSRFSLNESHFPDYIALRNEVYQDVITDKLDLVFFSRSAMRYRSFSLTFNLVTITQVASPENYTTALVANFFYEAMKNSNSVVQPSQRGQTEKR